MTAATATTPTLERRRERRVPVHLPMLVRGTDVKGEWFEERTASENMCRGGTAFATRYAVALGMRVEITIPARLKRRIPMRNSPRTAGWSIWRWENGERSGSRAWNLPGRAFIACLFRNRQHSSLLI